MLNIKKLYLNLFALNCMFILSGPLKHARATSDQVRRLFASHDRHYATAGAIITDTCWLLIKHLLIGGRPTGRTYTIAIARSFSDHATGNCFDWLVIGFIAFEGGGGWGFRLLVQRYSYVFSSSAVKAIKIHTSPYIYIYIYTNSQLLRSCIYYSFNISLLQTTCTPLYSFD